MFPNLLPMPWRWAVEQLFSSRSSRMSECCCCCLWQTAEQTQWALCFLPSPSPSPPMPMPKRAEQHMRSNSCITITSHCIALRACSWLPGGGDVAPGGVLGGAATPHAAVGGARRAPGRPHRAESARLASVLLHPSPPHPIRPSHRLRLHPHPRHSILHCTSTCFSFALVTVSLS